MFTYIEMVFTEENVCAARYFLMIPPRKLQPLSAHFGILWNTYKQFFRSFFGCICTFWHCTPFVTHFSHKSLSNYKSNGTFAVCLYKMYVLVTTKSGK